MRLYVLPVVIALSLAAGCSFLQEHESSAEFTTKSVTLKVIDGDASKAERVESIASDVQAYAGSEVHLTVDLLIRAIEERVDLDRLDPADRLLVEELIDSLRAELIRRLGPGVLPEDLRLAVDTVAGWVIDAARMT